MIIEDFSRNNLLLLSTYTDGNMECPQSMPKKRNSQVLETQSVSQRQELVRAKVNKKHMIESKAH